MVVASVLHFTGNRYQESEHIAFYTKCVALSRKIATEAAPNQKLVVLSAVQHSSNPLT